eukprot:CAMPEP_0117517640 /NCGR_PEP_ID=MMETSP0784-20121206/31716_2 /TAXON_ID=39447 /ORGANISM="" /LENGTH=50 /DNA_ID=CAMNT_0005313527 /DNA_START=1 /DNA_END=150 /DNA_ORIENTATION=-
MQRVARARAEVEAIEANITLAREFLNSTLEKSAVVESAPELRVLAELAER